MNEQQTDAEKYIYVAGRSVQFFEGDKPPRGAFITAGRVLRATGLPEPGDYFEMDVFLSGEPRVRQAFQPVEGVLHRDDPTRQPAPDVNRPFDRRYWDYDDFDKLLVRSYLAGIAETETARPKRKANAKDGAGTDEEG